MEKRCEDVEEEFGVEVRRWREMMGAEQYDQLAVNVGLAKQLGREDVLVWAQQFLARSLMDALDMPAAEASVVAASAIASLEWRAAAIDPLLGAAAGRA